MRSHYSNTIGDHKIQLTVIGLSLQLFKDRTHTCLLLLSGNFHFVVCNKLITQTRYSNSIGDHKVQLTVISTNLQNLFKDRKYTWLFFLSGNFHFVMCSKKNYLPVTCTTHTLIGQFSGLYPKVWPAKN